LAESVPANRIVFAGRRADIERWFAAMDVFVHAPRLEAFGLVVAEAMATGLPVVATRVGGVPDMVREDVNGLLVDSEQPNRLADAMERLLLDGELRERYGGAGRRIAESEYSAELYARRHLQLYEDVVAGRRPRGADEQCSPSPTAETSHETRTIGEGIRLPQMTFSAKGFASPK
jgi:glycosyltransferase involved in cell wall biosynthesis